MEHTPLLDILTLSKDEASQPGTYSFSVPPSVCFGIVSIGGLLISVAHVAGQRYIAETADSFQSQTAQSAGLPSPSSSPSASYSAAPTSLSTPSTSVTNHNHLLQASTYFFRPFFSTPRRGQVRVQPLNRSKLWSTLNVSVHQDGRRCLSGTLVFTDLSLRERVSAPTGWTLRPSPLPACLESLSADTDDSWVSFKTPLSPVSIRNSQAYIKYYIPARVQDFNYLDMYVTPAWDGGRWTNELVHFVIDAHLPNFADYLPASVAPYCRLDAVIAAGLEQRRARREGRDDMMFGEGCAAEGPEPLINSSVVISVEMKKLLPAEGTRWLFMRCFSTKLADNRLDEQVYVLDEFGDIVAVASLHSHLVASELRSVDKRVKL